MSFVIQASGLSKTYTVRRKRGNAWQSFFTPEVQRVEALRDATFAIGEGELVGYIGPNGAGKSTTVKILSGILVPDGGACTVLGMTPWRERVRYVREIGVVFGQRSQLWWDLPVRDSFGLLQAIYRVPKASFARTQDDLVSRLSLAPLLDTPVRQLSLGQRMRCELAASLLHQPRLLFLDEPSIGLDAVSKIAVRDFIRACNRERGTTVILTTHDMDDIESLCSRVLLIGQGRLLQDGPLAALREGHPERILTVELEKPLEGAWLPPGVQILSTEANRAKLRFHPAHVRPDALIALLAARGGIRDVTVEYTAIEEIIAARYMQMQGGAL